MFYDDYSDYESDAPVKEKKGKETLGKNRLGRTVYSDKPSKKNYNNKVRLKLRKDRRENPLSSIDY